MKSDSTEKTFSFEKVSGIKESIADHVKHFISSTDKDRLVKTDSVETYQDATTRMVSSFTESLKHFTSSTEQLTSSFKEVIKPIFPPDRDTSGMDTVSSFKETVISSINSIKESSNSVLSTNGNSLIKEYLSFVNKEHDQNHTFVKENTESLKEFIISNFDKVLPYEKPPSATIVKGDNESKLYESYFKESLIDKQINQIEKLHVNATSFKDSLSSFIKESISSVKTAFEKVVNNYSSSKEVSSTDHSVTIERIINNNFFSSESFKESFKSMSLTDLQKTFHIPAFATGGAVFGPTLAILGEGFGISRSNPEFVGTASQLKGIQSGVFDVNVNVDGELSFSMGKLAIALNREQRSSFRTSGKKGF